MPVEFLTDDEAAAYGRYAGTPSQGELDRMFFLDDADRALIARRRGDHTRLGFALQLTTVRYLGTFLPDPLEVPAVVLDRLAGQLQIADPSCVKRYTERRTTPFEHRDEIKAAYGLREFSEAAGSIGRDGWIGGDGYDVRLIPSWYALTQTGNPGQMTFIFPFDGATIDLQSLPAGSSAGIAESRHQLLRLGAHRALLDGAPGLRITRSGLPGGVLEHWFIVRGPAVYLITLHQSPDWPGDSPDLRHDLARMLSTWHWTNPAKASPTAPSSLGPGSLTGTWTGSYPEKAASPRAAVLGR